MRQRHNIVRSGGRRFGKTFAAALAATGAFFGIATPQAPASAAPVTQNAKALPSEKRQSLAADRALLPRAFYPFFRRQEPVWIGRLRSSAYRAGQRCHWRGGVR